jgi:hypothetical protein
VPVRHPIAVRHEHPGRDAEVHLVGGVNDQDRIGASRHHRNQMGQSASWRRQRPDAVEDQVLHCAWHPTTVRLQQLSDQQGVATGKLLDRFTVTTHPACLLVHAFPR